MSSLLSCLKQTFSKKNVLYFLTCMSHACLSYFFADGLDGADLYYYFSTPCEGISLFLVCKIKSHFLFIHQYLS